MDWTLCVICQNATEEKLNCPLSSKHSEHKAVYSEFLDRARMFKELNLMPIEFDVENANHVVWEENNASWHNSCRNLFSEYRLQRVVTSNKKNRKRKSTRSTTAAFEKTKCVFCQEDLTKDLHKCAKLDDKMKRMAHTLEDDRLIGLFEQGDVVALDIQYHRDCLTTYERAYTRKISPARVEFSTTDVAKEEIMSKIEDDISSGVTVFSMHDLINNYQTLLGDTVSTVNHTRLKHDILIRFPDFQEQLGSRRCIYLIASKEMRQIVSDNITDTDRQASILVKAAMICRRAVSSTKPYKFGGSLHPSHDIVPPQMAQLVRLLLYGYQRNADNAISNPEKSLSELIVYNMENLTSHGMRETPFPLYVGIWLHSQTRSKKLIKCMSEMGISVSFDRVLAIEKRLAEIVANQARIDGVVCPQNMQKQLFTVGALDNLDHNPTSRTAKTSFHGTGISVFQQRTVNTRGIPRDTLNYNDVCESTSQQLPDSYTVVPPLTRSLVTDVPPARERGEPLPEVIHREMLVETEWKNHVLQLLRDDPDGEPQLRAMWSSYHASRTLNTALPLPAATCMLPLFYESSSNPGMVKHGMEIVSQVVQFLNPGQIPVMAVDQPLYAIAKKLQWTYPDELGEEKFVVLMGGLHIEMALWHTLGDILHDSGWVEKVAESGIATPGTAASFLSAADPMKTRYAHQVTVAAMNIVLEDAYTSSDTTLPLMEWVSERIETNPTFAFWILVMKYQQLILLFVRAHRQRNFQLFVELLKVLVGLFFALDHHNYARWLPVFVSDLESLPPSVATEFNDNGSWTITRSMNRFSSIAIDHAHEQNNKQVKGVGGIIGLTDDPVSLAKWILIAPNLAGLVDDFRATNQDPGEMQPHHEEGTASQTRFLMHVRNMVDSLLQSENPFRENERELVSLHGRVCLSASSAKAVREIDTIGRSQYEEYKASVLENRTLDIQTPVKKNKLLFFKQLKARKTVTQKHLSHFKDQTSLYGQLFVSLHTRQGNLDLFFQHESTIPPPAMKMTNDDKSALYHCIVESISTAEETVDDLELPPTAYDVVVIDGGALIHTMPPRPSCSTFGDYADTVFLPRLRSELRSSDRVDVIWDRYFPMSIKASTRSKRANEAGGGTRQRVAGNAKMPQGQKHWSQFLADSSNKDELFKFLSTEATKASFPDCKDVYLTSGACVLHIGPGDEMKEQSNHEEADTRIVLHVIAALEKSSSILIRTGDTDVLIIILSQFSRFYSMNPALDIWMAFGSGKNQRMLHINRLHEIIGQARCHALPIFHAISGCDTTNGLKTKGKRMWWNTWNNHTDVTQHFLAVAECPFNALTGEHSTAVEDFICKLYDKTSTTSEVNVLRMNMFCQKSQDVQRIPPTHDALQLHLLRAVYQASIWYTSHQPMLSNVSPCSFGWTESDNKLVPVWTLGSTATQAFKLTVKCGCRKKCTGACSCQKENIVCTPLCKCPCLG